MTDTMPLRAIVDSQPTSSWQPRLMTARVATLGVPRELTHGEALLAALTSMALGDPARARLRGRTIEWYLPLATHLARRFNNRGEPVGDLIQVASIGLIKAIDRYDPSRATPFVSYAYPTIIGEIKRHFRDTTWAVHTPRGLQEARGRLMTAIDDMTGRLQRLPTTPELAIALGISVADIGEVRLAAAAYATLSVYRTSPEGETTSLLDAMGRSDRGLDAVDHRLTLGSLLAELTEREQRIVRLRFGNRLTQAEIATQIGVSQMQISRILTRSLTRLRGRITASDAGDSGRQ